MMVDPCTSMENWTMKGISMVKLWLQSILELMANFLLGGQGFPVTSNGLCVFKKMLEKTSVMHLFKRSVYDLYLKCLNLKNNFAFFKICTNHKYCVSHNSQQNLSQY